MNRRAPLPDAFADGPFMVAAALEGGVSPSRLRSKDLVTPFQGVRTAREPADVLELAAAFAPRMRPGHVYAGVTAGRLRGLPIAAAWERSEPLFVGVPVLGPASTVMSLARETPHADLVVLIDALITPSQRYRDLRLSRRPFTDPAALAAFAERCRGLHGASAFAAAVDDARVGADSPQETRCRLTIVAAGLPEPVVQFEVWVDGVLRAEIDLAYPDWKIAIEYEGEHHLTDAAQWAKDIRRQELLESLGWIVIRVTKADLHEGGRSLIERVRAALARRGVEA